MKFVLFVLIFHTHGVLASVMGGMFGQDAQVLGVRSRVDTRTWCYLLDLS